MSERKDAALKLISERKAIYQKRLDGRGEDGLRDRTLSDMYRHTVEALEIIEKQLARPIA